MLHDCYFDLNKTKFVNKDLCLTEIFKIFVFILSDFNDGTDHVIEKMRHTEAE